MSYNIYISSNPDRLKLGKSKYGYVKGDKQNLANRLTDSTEQFSDLSTFTRVWSFKKMDKYNEEYSIIDGLISFACRNIEKIEELETNYECSLSNMRELYNNHYLVSGTNKYNEFIANEGIPIFERILKYDFPKLGLELVKTYTPDEVYEINRMGREKIEKKYREV